MINSFHTTMRKILLLFVMLCLAQTAVKADTDLTAYGNVIFVSPATVGQKSGNEVTLDICMNNTAPVRGFQFDLHLPDGMTAVKTENGKIMASLNPDRLPQGDDHTLTVAEQADGSIRFLCGSPYNETFTGMWGPIATIRVNFKGMAKGWYPLRLKAIKLSESDISRFYEVSEVVTRFTVLADAGTGSTDISAYDNVIFVSPAFADQTKSGNAVTLDICMNNTAPIRGFQFDLYLPEGMTAVKTSDDRFVTSLNAARLPVGDGHTLTVAEQADGALRFLCGSPYNETFTGTSGMIATLLVNIEGLVWGEYPMTLKAIKLSESDISRFYEVPEIVTKFTVGYNTTDIGDSQRETVPRRQWYTPDGRLLNGKPTAKGVYIVNGKTVVIK